MEMCLGGRVLECLFDRMEEFDDESVVMSFPERWLNILEQRVLFERLERYGANLKTVVIKTHSVYIIQCAPNTCCRILPSEEPLAQGHENGRLYSGPDCQWINPDAINVL
jgi:hypothetical protein